MYKRRLFILLGILLLGFGVLLGRLGYMQLLHGQQYRQLAETMLQTTRLLPGQRGRILDRNGVILAEDEPCHDFCLDYRFLIEEPRWVDRQKRQLARELGVDRDDPHVAELYRKRRTYTWRLARSIAERQGQSLDHAVQDVVRDVQRIRRAVGREVREERMAHAVVVGLSDTEAVDLQEPVSRAPGAELKPSHQRQYPMGSLGCHIIGTTRPVYREDLETNLSPDEADWITRMQTNYLPGDVVGESGVERLCEPLLRPRRGYRRYRKPGELTREQPPRDGRDVHLSIDIRLQAAVTELLASSGRNGSVVVLDVASGDILAMVSWPTYNLNTYRRDYADLLQDPRRPLIHRAVMGQFEPGSTVKPIVAMAGLASRQIQPTTTFVCEGFVHRTPSGNKVLRCWKRSGHGRLDLVGALEGSCNVYFPRVADRLGTEGLIRWLEWFGFHRLPGTGLAEEASGVLPTRQWLMDHRDGGSWYPSDRWFLSVGQGSFTATPLQVACAHAILARGGVARPPVLVAEAIPGRETPETMTLDVPEAYVQAVHRGMYQVVNDPSGTAYRAWRMGQPIALDVCGKTGTAQTPREGQNHAWFAGFAPYGNPEIVVTVLLEYAGSGGENSAPIAKDVFRICQELGLLGGR